MGLLGCWFGRIIVVSASLTWIVLLNGGPCLASRTTETASDPTTSSDESLKESSAFALFNAVRESYPSNPCLPRHIHLSQESNVNPKDCTVSIIISFTLAKHTECNHMTPVVVVNNQRYEASVEPQQFNFTSSTTGEFYQSDWIYHVPVRSLSAGRLRYDYRIQVERKRSILLRGATAATKRIATSTPRFSFHTPPLPGSPTSVALVGDLGQTHNSTLTMSHVLRATVPHWNRHPVSLLTIVGDLSYADSDPHRWSSWFELMEPLLRTIPTHVAAGNHEIECDNVNRNVFTAYEQYFRNPNRVKPAEITPATEEQKTSGCSTPSTFLGNYQYGNSFYSYSHGLMTMVVLNSYSDSRVGSTQYRWLEQELKGVNRIETPWLVVSFHSPYYNTFNDHVNETEALRMQQAMEPLFLRHGVNLVVNGHVHAYMRTHPMAYGKRDSLGPVYSIIGSGGNREGHSSGYQHETPEPWVAVRDTYEFGYAHFFMANATHAHWSWIRDGTTDEGVRDQTWLINPHVGSSWAKKNVGSKQQAQQ